MTRHCTLIVLSLTYTLMQYLTTHSGNNIMYIGEVVFMGTQSCIRRTRALWNSRSTISTIWWITSLFPLIALSSWLKGLNGEEMNTDHVLHGLGYAHSVTYCNAMRALNYAILGHFVIFKCFLKAFILCEQYQVFFHSGCRELLRYLKSAILF